jgi:hypothetical protein
LGKNADADRELQMAGQLEQSQNSKP